MIDEVYFSKQITRILEIRGIKTLRKLNFYFFPFFYFLIFVFIGVEAYMFSGFLGKQIFLDLRLILILFVFSGVLAKSSLTGERTPQTILQHYQIISTLNKLLLPSLVFINFLLFSIEKANYPGYIYTRVIHIEPTILFYSLLVALLVLILDFDNSLVILEKRFKSRRADFRLLIFLVLLIVLGNMIKSLAIVNSKFQFILKNPNLSYEEKMRKSWGNFYDYMMFINEQTYPEATVMHPPHDSPWETVGNGGLIRYFIYPRDEVYSTKGISEKGNKPTHLMIAYGWPDFPVKAKKLIYMPKTATESAEIIYGNYDPENPRNKDKEVLGLIELKEE